MRQSTNNRNVNSELWEEFFYSCTEALLWAKSPGDTAGTTIFNSWRWVLPSPQGWEREQDLLWDLAAYPHLIRGPCFDSQLPSPHLLIFNKVSSVLSPAGGREKGYIIKLIMIWTVWDLSPLCFSCVAQETCQTRSWLQMLSSFHWCWWSGSQFLELIKYSFQGKE